LVGTGWRIPLWIVLPFSLLFPLASPQVEASSPPARESQENEPSVQTEIRERVLQPSVKVSGAAGVAFTLKDGTCYILTAYHVIENLQRRVTRIVDGKEVTFYLFDDAEIVQEILTEDEQGNIRKVGEIRIYAEVIAWTPLPREGGYDLALLRLRKKGVIGQGARFPPPDYRPYISQEIYHVGTVYGLAGSLDKGIIAALGRIVDGRVYHQTSATAGPGSSGGGVFTKIKNRFYYVGMVTLGIMSEGNINLFIPVRVIRNWLQEAVKEIKKDNIKKEIMSLFKLRPKEEAKKQEEKKGNIKGIREGK